MKIRINFTNLRGTEELKLPKMPRFYDIRSWRLVQRKTKCCVEVVSDGLVTQV